jgi:DNA polymerase-3 subunit alpha
MQSKYGYTSQIITFNKLSQRSLVRAVGKVLCVSKESIDSAAKSIPKNTEPNITLSELQNQIVELSNIDPKVIGVGTKLHRVIRHHGKHPGGVVISDKPISNVIPLCLSKRAILTQFDKDDIEAAGLLKMDILGSKYLSVVGKTLEFIEQRHGVHIIYPDSDDSKAYDVICSGDVSGIFQLGQECGKEIVNRMQPRNLDELVQLISIDRPGVISSGLVDKYFEAKSRGNVRCPHPAFEPILNETLGVIIYQEQIMRIAVEIAGFDWIEADKLRKAISKQKVDVMKPFEDKFITGLIIKDVPKQTAEELWEQILHFGSYCFNKAHAVGYAKLTYMTAYLKAHYPMEYIASLISVMTDSKEERRQYVSDAMVKGIKVHTPDINISSDVCVIKDDTIYLPLTMIDGVGPVAYENIMEERSKVEFKSIPDFFERIDKRRVSKSIRRNLVKAGAFDGLHDRLALLKRIFNANDSEVMIMEKEVLGVYVSGYLSNELWYNDGSLHINEIADLSSGDEFTTTGIVGKVYEHVDRNGNTMAFVTLEDNTGQVEVVIFASVYNCPLVVGDIIFLTAKLSEYEPLKVIAVGFSLLHSQTLS